VAERPWGFDSLAHHSGSCVRGGMAFTLGSELSDRKVVRVRLPPGAQLAEVGGMADPADLKSVARKGVQVQVLSSAPFS
jgi:hypothetical protein